MPAGDHKAAMSRQDSMTEPNINNKKEPQKRHHLGTISTIFFTEGLILVSWNQQIDVLPKYERTKVNMFLFISFSTCLDAQKNSLIEAVLSSNHNIFLD